MVRDNIAVLTEDWNDLERCSDSWCQEQVCLITDQLLELTGMNKNKINKILASYELHDDDDISTERLLQMVADDCHCDVSDVVDALNYVTKIANSQ